MECKSHQPSVNRSSNPNRSIALENLVNHEQLLLRARRVREDQTFDLYAQQLENVWRGLCSGMLNEEQAQKRVQEIEQEIAEVREAIRKVQKEKRC
jgi:cytochrome c-type biogenesis protein CcmH/NrfG